MALQRAAKRLDFLLGLDLQPTAYYSFYLSEEVCASSIAVFVEPIGRYAGHLEKRVLKKKKNDRKKKSQHHLYTSYLPIYFTDIVLEGGSFS